MMILNLASVECLTILTQIGIDFEMYADKKAYGLITFMILTIFVYIGIILSNITFLAIRTCIRAKV